MKLKLEGLIAAPFTPFNDSGELALGQIEKLANLYNKNGVKGVFICGSTGEGVALTFDEKIQVLKAWGGIDDPSLKKVFMVGGTSLKEMQSLAKLAQENQLDAISMMSPYYFKPTKLEHLVDFCYQLAAVTPELPFYYYHIPVLTGAYFSMHKFLKLVDGRIPNFAGIKFSAIDLFDYQKCSIYINQKYQLLWGVDEALLAGLAAGARGAVGSTYNYAAPLYHRIFNAFQQGNMEEARHYQEKAVRMVDLLVKYGGNEAGKAFMKLIGIDCGWFRPPLQPLSNEQLSQLEKELTKIGFFEFCSKV